MWATEARGVTMDLFCFDGKLRIVDGCESLQLHLDREPKDGQFYRIVADVTYLNGGIAGYYNYPQIDDVTSVERISASDLNIPSITEKRYGLTRIGDYADGDLFLNAFEMRAVWKNGTWVYRYDKGSVAEDGRFICRRNGVADEKIEAGVAKGVLSCADYFVAPAVG